MWCVVLSLLVLTLGALTIFLTIRTLELTEKIDRLNEQVDESLTVLEGAYRGIAHAADTPVLSDEPLIKKLMSDIRSARDAVVAVMNMIGTFDQEEAQEQDETQEER